MIALEDFLRSTQKQLFKRLVKKFNGKTLLKFIIELDRKGKNGAVYYCCANPDFEAHITSKDFKTAQGKSTI